MIESKYSQQTASSQIYLPHKARQKAAVALGKVN